MPGAYWTDEETKFITDNYLTMSCAEMAERLPGRTTRSVQHKFGLMGLKRPLIQVGEKHNRLTVTKIYEEQKYGQMHSWADADCECGNKVSHVRLSQIKRGQIKSCGCLRDEKAAERCRERTTHGKTDHPIYKTWAGMLTRARNQNIPCAKNYSLRGIGVCDEWLKFEVFYDWAIANGWEQGLTIDRKDVDGNYCPENCQWATHSEQNNNKRSTRYLSAWGESKSLAEWLTDPRCQVTRPSCITDRIDVLGWDTEKAIATPKGATM